MASEFITSYLYDLKLTYDRTSVNEINVFLIWQGILRLNGAL